MMRVAIGAECCSIFQCIAKIRVVQEGMCIVHVFICAAVRMFLCVIVRVHAWEFVRAYVL